MMSVSSIYKVILLYTVLFLQSCASIRSGRSNIHINIRDLLTSPNLLERRELKIVEDRIESGSRISVRTENEPMIHEVRGKLGRLRNEHFLDHYDIPNNPTKIDKMKEELMFIFYHWLICKQSRDMSVQDKVRYFSQLRNEQGNYYPNYIDNQNQLEHPDTVWKLIYNSENDRAEFKIKDLYQDQNIIFARRNRNNETIEELQEEQEDNLSLTEDGKAPWSDFGAGFERVDVDHLIRNNRVTIELPNSLHKLKNKFIDNLTNLPKREVKREPANHWRNRFQERNNRNIGIF